LNTKRICLAIDLGASSGRVVAGIYDGIPLKLDELNRFSTLFETKIFEPRNPTLWNDAYQRFQNILTR